MQNIAVVCGCYHNYKIIFVLKFLTPSLKLDFGDYILLFYWVDPIIPTKGFSRVRFTRSQKNLEM